MTKIGDLTLYNLDRQQSACFGGEPSDHDFCHVYDSKSRLVMFGTKKECYEWINKNVITEAKA